MTEIDQMSPEELEITQRHDFLTFMLTRGGLRMSTLAQNTVDLLSAGIDTVCFLSSESYTMSSLLSVVCSQSNCDIPPSSHLPSVLCTTCAQI